MKYIERSVEKNFVDLFKTFKAVLVTGARQTGKSTMIKKLFPDMSYVTFDDPFVENQAKNSAESFLMLNPSPVIFDEIQRVPELFRYIKIKCDESENKSLFILSGSQPFRLMQNVSESLSGRVGILEIAGLSLREIQGDNFNVPFIPTMEYVMNRKKSVNKPSNIWDIIHKGSYPELYQTNSPDWNKFYSSYLQTYLERDVRELAAVQDLDVFRRFMVAVAVRTGEMINYANIANEIGKDLSTVKKWISILEASGIIYILEPFTNSVLTRVIKTPKLYFKDTGLACYLTRWLTSETLALGAMAGSMFETFVVDEIIKSYMNVGIDYKYCISYYRGKDKLKKKKDGELIQSEAEIDLIIEQNGCLYPIEIKKNTSEVASATSAFRVLDKIEDKKRGMGAVISMCPAPGVLRENVLEIPVWYI